MFLDKDNNPFKTHFSFCKKCGRHPKVWIESDRDEIRVACLCKIDDYISEKSYVDDSDWFEKVIVLNKLSKEWNENVND